MPRDNVEIVRRIYAAWERGDYSEDWWAADDIEYELRGLPAARVRGRSAMAQAWREWLSGWRRFHTRAQAFRDLGDVVVVPNRFGGEGRTSGIVPDAFGATVFTISNGKVVRLVVHNDVAEAFAELGIDDE